MLQSYWIYSKYIDDATSRSSINENTVDLTTSLLDLNDDVLLEIMNTLALFELSSVGLSCKRLNFLARNVFRRRCRDQFIVLDTKELIADHNLHADQFVQYLTRAFGDLICNLRVILDVKVPVRKYEQLNDIIITSISEYCSNAIERFEIIGFCWDQKLPFPKSVKFYHQANKLCLKDWFQLNDESITDFRRLEKLSVNAHSLHYFTSQIFPKLKYFTLTQFQYFRIEPGFFHEFFANHQNLIEIELNGMQYCDPAVICSMRALESIVIRTPLKPTFAPLLAAHHIKTVVLDALNSDKVIIQFLRIIPSPDMVTQLDIWNYDGDQSLVDTIVQFKNLQMLTFNGNLHFKDVQFECLKIMKKLTKLNVRNPLSITSSSLIAVLNELQELNELTLEMLYDGKITLTPRTLMELRKIYRTRDRRLLIRNYLNLHETKSTVKYEDEHIVYIEKCYNSNDLLKKYFI